MGMLSEVKCARCDRRYSGLRSRCPYCGARRIGRGKYSGENDDSMGKMLIGILIMVVLIGAVVVLLISSGGDKEPQVDVESPPPTHSSSLPGEEDNFVVEETPSFSPPEVEETPEETPTPVAVVESLTITYSGSKREDITMFTSDPQLLLSARVVPDEIEEPVVWTSSNSGVFEAVATDTTGRSAKITPMGSGTATLTISIGDVSAECIIRVRQK